MTGTPAGGAGADPRPAAVAFATSELFALQSGRSATIAESVGRAGMFLSAVSGGLVALGLVAAATGVDSGFYAFAGVLLATLAFVGFVTFERVLQSGIEDQGYARRIARVRGYYLDVAPELAPYMLDVPSAERLSVQGLLAARRGQRLRTIAGMVAVVTAVLAGGVAGVIGAAASDGRAAAALPAGVVVAAAVLVVLERFQRTSVQRELGAQPSADGERRD